MRTQLKDQAELVPKALHCEPILKALPPLNSFVLENTIDLQSADLPSFDLHSDNQSKKGLHPIRSVSTDESKQESPNLKSFRDITTKDELRAMTEAQFDELRNLTKSVLLRISTNINQEMIEDVATEVWIRLVKYLDIEKAKNSNSIVPLTSLCIKHAFFRFRTENNEMVPLKEPDLHAGPDTTIEAVLGREVRRTKDELIQESLTYLKPKEQDLLIRSFNGESNKEASQRLGINSFAYKTRLCRAKAKLKSALEGIVTTEDNQAA